MRERRSQRPDVLWIAALAAGCAALFARPLATGAGWGVVVAVGVLGIAVPVGPPGGKGGRAWWWGVTSVGVAAFAAARMLAVHTPAPGTWLALAATGVAAIAEEAFFRRFLYGWLARWGEGMAVAGAAAAFAAVHLRGYGVWSLPVNLAAGALFGWQRWATGRWDSSAVTHAIANLLQSV